MKGKKKNVIKVIIVLLVIGGIFYFAQPWIVYYTGPPQWTYERLCQSVQSGSYWNSARGRALDVDGHPIALAIFAHGMRENRNKYIL